MNKMKTKIDAKFIAKTGIFAALSVILYVVPIFKVALPFFPPFLEIHFDEIPALISGFAYGPISALFVLIVKTLVKLPFSSTACVGELADFIYSCAFLIPASLIYKKHRKFKFAVLAISIGSVIQAIVASMLTTFVMLDLYTLLMPGLTKEAILGMCQSINPNIVSLDWPFLFMVALPFNLLKDVIVGLLTILLYKKLHTLIDKIGQQKN